MEDRVSTNLSQKASNGDRKQTTLKSCADYLNQLALVMGQEIQPDRVALYLTALAGLNENQIKHGFDFALRNFKPEFGKTFPYPAEIREWAEQWRPGEHTTTTRRFQSVSEIDPERCPKGWTPEDVFRAHLTQEKIRSEARRPPVQDRHEEDLQGFRQRLRQAAELKSMPTYRENAERLVGESNGKS